MSREVNIELKKQMDLLVQDILLVYNSSGKKTTGKFEEGLEVVYSENSAILKGYTYLTGRKAGKMPPIAEIKKWVEAKGIRPIKDNITTTSLAWAIATNIAKYGTRDENHLKIYEQVLTPQRMDDIISKVNQVNVNWFINELQAQMTIITKNK